MSRPGHYGGARLVAGARDNAARWRRAPELSAVGHDYFTGRIGEPDIARHVTFARRCDRMRDIHRRRIDEGWMRRRSPYRWHRFPRKCSVARYPMSAVAATAAAPALLRRMFDAAIASAQPAVCIPQHVPRPPR